MDNKDDQSALVNQDKSIDPTHNKPGLDTVQKPPTISTQNQPNPKNKKKLKKTIAIMVSIMTFLVLIATASLLWFKAELSPVSGDISQMKKIEIRSGSTPSQISDLLEKESLIKNSLVFDIYARFSGKSSNLQAGVYRLSPAESTPQIIDHLVNGSVDEFSITFLPGGTLSDVKKVLKDAGYPDSEIKTALEYDYTTPLLADKPANADLEGYVYGQTYKFNSGATAVEVLSRTFEQFYADLKSNNLIQKYQNNGLKLYQAITLASIIQKEVSGEDQKQVAQVFLTRLGMDMELGSDVTYQYVADKMGVARDVNLDSPYNTRRYKGLPPGPISSPGLSALKAVAEPAQGDYLYFLSGDDDITYFAKTYEEHESNIVKHCSKKCSVN